MDVFWGIFEFIKDIAFLAAAVGVAKWAWDQHKTGDKRRDEEARAAMAREREIADLGSEARKWGARMEALAVDISTRLDEILVRERDAEERMTLKLAIHKTLQFTDDPYLTLDEIGKAVGESTQGASPPSETDLRRALIEMVADGVVAQIERDRYFVASDYDAEESDD